MSPDGPTELQVARRASSGRPHGKWYSLEYSRFANGECILTGMLKPQDILVVLKIAALGGSSWTYKSLSEAVGLSAASVHESVQRAIAAGFLNPRERRVVRTAVEEFFVHGLRYILPPERGRVARGIATATSAPVFRSRMAAQDIPLVWAFARGDVRGETLEPLHPSVPEAAGKDDKLYRLLAVADALRAGSPREREVAAEILKELLAS